MSQSHDCLDNDVAPIWRQTIVWTNDGIVYWRIYASLGLDDLIKFLLSVVIFLNKRLFCF